MQATTTRRAALYYHRVRQCSATLRLTGTTSTYRTSTLSKDHPTLLSNSGPDQEYDLELDLMVLLARAKYQVKRFHFQLAASLCLERTGAVKSAPQARAKRALDGLTGQTVVSTENRVGCGAFGHAISPQFTPSEARSSRDQLRYSFKDLHSLRKSLHLSATALCVIDSRRLNHAHDCAQVYVAHRKVGQNDLGPRRLQRRGPSVATLGRSPSHRWSYPAMSRHCCPVPPRDADRREGPRSSSTARVPPLLCAFLDLSPL